MEELRKIPDLMATDQRHAIFSVYDPDLGDFRQKTLEDHHLRISKIALADHVPEEIQDQFQTARNLLIYAWFVYPFIPIAEMQAYVCLEFALRCRVGSGWAENATLKPLLDHAISKGWICDQGFAIHRQGELDEAMRQKALKETGCPLATAEKTDPQRYAKILVETFPLLRNQIAHGTPMLMPGGYFTLVLVSEMINQLFANKPLPSKAVQD